MKKSKRLNHYIRLACLTGALFCYSASAFAVVMPNTQLPQGGEWILGTGSDLKSHTGNSMTITQDQANAVIKWSGKDYGFSIGSIASVLFDSKVKKNGQFNILNYDASGVMSQIRGTLKTTEGGNVYIVNPAGVFIGNSAQVDVGSLYVSNKKLKDDALGNFNGTAASINDMIASDQPATPAELMSLGHINATEVTFDGSRIVLDTELLTTKGLEHPIEAKNIHINTDDSNKVVIGYDGYDATINDYDKTHKTLGNLVNLQVVNSKNEIVTKDTDINVKGYMWVRDLEQLQAIGKDSTNKSGSYALRNGIGAISTKTGNFTPIGNSNTGEAFTGKFDGLAGNVDGIDFAIFDLHVTGGGISADGTTIGQSNLGLFGKTEGAEIRNVLLTGGEVTGTGDNIGALVGKANNTTIENVRNSINVIGGTKGTDGKIISSSSQNVGGIVGSADGTTKISNILNTGDISGFANVGGVVGSIVGNTDAHAVISGAENIGRVQGVDNPTYSHDIGGIAGSASNTDISNVENNLQIVGGYNVGGIVGSGEGVSIKGAVNNADVTAKGYTTEEYKYTTEVDGKREKILTVNVANAGGIAGSISGKSSLSDVTNDGGNVSTESTENDIYGTYYHAGNVGGIVGSAVGTDANNTVTITNAENKENTVFGAHNVGGVAGYLENGTITLSSNNGGEVTGTGARTSIQQDNDGDVIIDYQDNFAYESIRYRNNERFLIGNMGGIVGYMYGDNAFVSQSGNRGNVHSQKFDTSKDAPLTAKTANVGGIVGKINRNAQNTLEEISRDEKLATVYDSYNRGNVQGYTGVGGVIGLMYNGAVAVSDNSGTVMATRKSSTETGSREALNMGGIVGDTTEEGNARAVIYDVHNDGIIGSDKFTDFYGRHVGGVVGRLSGDVEKAYNTGAIYNGYNVVGGIAGYMAAGSIKNSFNTGNITVYNQNNDTSQVGGIVGGLAVGPIKIENAYNLGTIRSFKSENGGQNAIGGIVGGIFNWGGNTKTLDINNVYTLGNLYESGGGSIGAIYGYIESTDSKVTVSNAYYIKPQISETSGNDGFRTLTGNNLNGATPIAFDDRGNKDSYGNFTFSNNGLNGTNVDITSPWRIYNYEAPDGSNIFTTPILNAFLPKAEDYFDNVEAVAGNRNNIASTQYGTAYNPLLTIINAENNDTGLNTISFDWNKINPDRSASFAVFNGNLSISDFNTQGNLYGGTLYAKGNLSINNAYSETEVDGKKYINSGDVLLGSGAKLYGSTINITSGTVEDGTTTLTNGGKLVNYGTIRSTGQVGDSSNITLQAEGNVEIIGEVTSNSETNVVVPNIGRYPTDPKEKDDDTNGKLAQQIIDNIANMNEAMPSVGDYYSRSFTSASQSGDVTITSQKGDVDVLLGVAQKGYINSSQDLTIEGQNVYVDSDLSIAGSLALNAEQDTVLDITNIGAVNVQKDISQEEAREAFVTHFKTTTTGDTNNNTISFRNPANAMITMDLWNGTSFKLDAHTTLGEELRKMSVNSKTGFDFFHIWIDDAAALQGINNATDNNILTYNFALKNDIDAAEVTGFEAIGTNTKDTKVFSGKFNGRGNTIVGLSVDNEASAGLFSKIGTDGKVSDLNIYSSSFNGAKVGAVAGINQGTIDNVTTFGNRVNGDEVVDGISSAGGIAGVNNGTISNAVANDAVATSVKYTATEHAFAGGIAGVNTAVLGRDAAKIDNSVANSDITSTEGAHALGGIVGSNSGNAVLDTVRSLGIVNGTYSVGNNNVISDNIGGIAGINEGGAQITKAYNVAHVSGGSNVGGIVGKLVGSNTNTTADKYDLQEVVSAGDVTSQGTDAQNVGGIVGSIQNEAGKYTYINSGRNTGEVTGVNNVGGLVGNNSKGSNLANVINDANATIRGETNVGGIAGTNAGVIDSELTDLVNDGFVYGQENVGGVAGKNTGTIRKTNSNITLYVKNEEEKAEYFGGAVGYNLGIINDAFNSGTIKAEKAEYVGGIVGYNDVQDDLVGTINGAENKNTGIVIGKNYVGGIAGYNKGNINGTATDPTIVQNFGFVQAKGNGLDNGGAAGGVVGVNNVNENNIEFASLINSGIVAGNGNTGTGGVIGVNNGDITKASLIGTVDAIVVGEGNVGGLIGINYGKVVGGRDAAVDGVGGDNYYAQQIYNNGKVIGGTTEFKDTLPDGSGANEWKEIGEPGNIKGYYKINAKTDSANIGGLVGNNANTLIAGYNTGDIKGGTNVGGVVGNNASGALVDQVFNAGAVSGGTNVGGVVGNNAAAAGNVKNAYNTNTSVSAAVGNGEGVAIQDDAAIWTTYGNGSVYGTNKLLKVFLTKLTFTPAPDNYKQYFDDSGNLVYNARKNLFEIKKINDKRAEVYLKGRNSDPTKPVLIGTLEFAGGAGAKHSLKDFFEGSGLLTGGSAQEVGDNYEMFASKQIATSSETVDGKFVVNPNNLGFDVQQLFGITNADLNITLDEVTRVYGDATIKGSTPDTITDSNKQHHVVLGDGTNPNYGYTITVGGKGEWNDEMRKELLGTGTDGILSTNTSKEKDLAVEKLLLGQTTTREVGEYDWSLKAELADNNTSYKLLDADGNQATNNIYTGSSKSHVTKAQLTIDLNDVVHEYGSPNLNNYGIKNVLGLTNGDDAEQSNLTVTMTSDSALKDENTHTSNAGGTYSWSGNISGIDNLANNYDIDVKAGVSKVTQKELTLSDILAIVNYGQKVDDWKDEITQDAKLVGLANGDTESDVHFTFTDAQESGAYFTNKGSRDTADAGRYIDNISLTGVALEGAKAGNYIISDTATGDILVNKAQLTLNDILAKITYGQKDIKWKDKLEGSVILGGRVNGDDTNDELDFTFTGAEVIGGSSYDTNRSGRNTADANAEGYANSLKLTGVELTGTSKGNYEITGNAGKIVVDTAKLTLSEVLAIVDYGQKVGDWTKEVTQDAQLIGLVNSDNNSTVNFAFDDLILNEASDYFANKGERNTADVKEGGYKDSLRLTGVRLTGAKAGNYSISDAATGSILVNKADLSFTVDNAAMTSGGLLPIFTGRYDGLVNGDTETTVKFGGYELDSKVNTTIAGVYADSIGVLIDGKLYFANAENVLKNYNLIINPGTLTVSDLEPTDPTNPDNPYSPDNPNNWQAEDKYPWYQWDKQRNERERKAEIHFVDGGMHVEA